MRLRGPVPSPFPYTTLFRSDADPMSASGRPFTQGLPPKTASAVDSPLFIQGLSPEKSPAVDFRLPRHRSEEHTSELQSPVHLVCRLLLEKKKPMQATQRLDR